MNNSFYTVLWLIWLLTALFAVYQSVGLHFMVNFFPEGKRWYQIPLQLISLGYFALVVLKHPF